MRNLFTLGLAIKIIVASLTLHNDLIFAWERPFNQSINIFSTNTIEPPLTYFFFIILKPAYFLINTISLLPLKTVLLKTPYLLIDIFILWVLLRVANEKLKRKT